MAAATARTPRPSAGALLRCALVSAALLAGLPQPRAALADGDPASDVLLAQNAYYPYQPRVSRRLEATLDGLLRSAERLRQPLKVAVIGSAADLGAVPSFFGHPQAYAQFLDREISFNSRLPLLVVMPAGFGVIGTGPPKALAAIEVDTRHGADGLVSSAIAAVAALSHTAGRPLESPASVSAGRDGGGPPTAVLFAVPGGLLALVGVLALFRDRRKRRPEAGEEVT